MRIFGIEFGNDDLLGERIVKHFDDHAGRKLIYDVAEILKKEFPQDYAHLETMSLSLQIARVSKKLSRQGKLRRGK